jgi:hypothetical protein
MNPTVSLRHLVFVVLIPLLGGHSRAIGRVVDDFEAGKNGWTDFSFDPALPAPQAEGGRFRFMLPPVGQPIFIASTKTSETFELREGRTVELRVDLVQGGGKDSFAVLAFIPTSTGASTLAGYGLSKSTTDVLISKGINKYFYNENPPEPIKNENVALSLTLSVRDGSVHVTGRVLDLENQGAVLFEQTVIDTPAADVLADGTDEPAAPYITEGHLVLYLYEDFDPGAPEDPYQAVYDNAEVFLTDREVLDDFDAGKEGWTDFSFDPSLPAPAVAGGRFNFMLPPVGQPIFIASTKSSRTFALREGERLEFEVDLVQGGGKDSFAILAFIPTATGAGTLAGYGIAKSTTDFLLTKGINKYFYNEDPPNPVKNDDITLSLTLTARGGSVYISGKVLDRAADNAVIFSQSAVDTPGADVMADGTDDPPGPYIGEGNFVLYLYEDFDQGAPEDPYQAIYDNAIVGSVPTTGDEPPLISNPQPATTSNFLPAGTALSFMASDDQPLNEDALSITLGETTYTRADGLTVTGSGNAWSASLGGVLEADRDYTALFRVVDAAGATREQTIHFDTFNSANRVIEIEDYNFAGGLYHNDPVPVPEQSGPGPNDYSNQQGIQDIDFSETRPGPNFTDTMYRINDPIRMARSLDKARSKFVAAGGPAASVYDYDVGDLVAGEWMNYTREFAAGAYEVYLREQVVNIPAADSVLELVVGDPTLPDPEVRLLGTFLGKRRGFDYQNVPLTDGSGLQKTVLRLEGTTTLRLRHLTSDTDDGYRLLNYLVVVPVEDPGAQRPAVVSTSPAPGTTVESLTPTIEVTIQNRDTMVEPETVRLTYNGAPTPSATITVTPDGARLTYPIMPLPASGATNSAVVVYEDTEGVSLTNSWQFVITYRSLSPADRLAGAGLDRGFNLRVVQAPLEVSPLENTLARAESQLAPGSTIPRVVDTHAVSEVINFNKAFGAMAGNFDNDLPVPGIEPELTGNGDNDFAVEILAYLELEAGIHRFGVVTDDGYKIAAGQPPISPGAVPLAFHNGGPANETFDLLVSEAGLYAFRMVWYERAGAGHAEWFSVDPATGDRVLINDPASADAIRAWRDLESAGVEVTLESAPAVTGPYAPEPGAIVDAGARTVRIPDPGANRFYRLRAGDALTLGDATIQGGTLVLTWR